MRGSGAGGRHALRVALVVLASAGLVAGVTPLTQNLAVDQTRATTSVDSMTVEGHELGYAGGDVTEVSVTVNNTGAELTADLRVSLSRKNGSQRAQATKSGVLFGPGTTTVTVSFDGSHDPATFARVDIRLASSL